MSQPLEHLTRKLGYEFLDQQLLKQALTHRSISSHNNERLEFLGDAMANFIIADALFQKFPESKEGELTRLRAKLVKGETMALIAKELELGDFLHLSMGELKSGGHQRHSILADALEAIIGAIYLDAGFEPVRDRVLAWYDTRLEDPDIFNHLKDPKTRLQEILQAKKLPLPDYKVAEITGEAHAQTFVIECTVDGLSFLSSGSDTNRRGAEQQAAQEFLLLIREEKDND